MSQTVSTEQASKLAEIFLSFPGLAEALQTAIGPRVGVGPGEVSKEVRESCAVGNAPDDVVVGVESLKLREEVIVESPAAVHSDWSEEVDGESVGTDSDGAVSTGSVVFPQGAAVVSEETRRNTKFGGAADHHEGTAGVMTTDTGGFMRSCVKAPHVMALKRFVEGHAYVKIPKTLMVEFALCAYASASVPVGFTNGRFRLKQFAIVGDAAMTLCLIESEVMRGGTVDSAQQIRSKFTCNAMLASVCVNSGLSACLVYPASVDPGTSKVSADAVEALVGFLHLFRGPQAVINFLKSLQLL